MALRSRHLPAAAALLLLAACLAFGLSRSLAANDGRLVYALDDAYIHMAVAKNLARHGVWGVTPERFTASTSSLSWVLILAAADALLGVPDILPLALNGLMAAALVLAAAALLRQAGVSWGLRLGTLILIVLAAPLPALVFTGQEHVLHALTSLLLMVAAARAVGARAGQGLTSLAALAGLAAFNVATRYEGLALVAAASLLLAARRRLGHALMVLAAGLAPIVAFGLVSRAHGWRFLPNSILTKANAPDLTSLTGLARALGYDGLRALMANSHLLILLVAALVALAALVERREQLFEERVAPLALFVLMALPHLQLAKTNHFYRYEAYLVVCGFHALALGAEELLARRRAAFALGSARLVRVPALALAALLLLSPFTVRARQSLSEIAVATHNIYSQQVQMGLFVAEAYAGQTIALNDIGAVTYLADIECVDLWGLASRQTARLQLERRFSVEAISRFALERGARVAITYFELGPPWIKLGEWHIHHNIVCAFPTVSFFAADPAEAAELARKLRAFAPRLPPDVEQRGAYLSAEP